MIEFLPLVILLSGILYRTPRGGGPLAVPSTQLARFLWAAPTAAGLAWIVQDYWPLLYIPLMMAGVTMVTGRWWPGDPNASEKVGNIRGLFVLNPFQGTIYFWCAKQNCMKKNLFKWRGAWMFDGSNSWGELFTGLGSATAYSAITLLITVLIRGNL